MPESIKLSPEVQAIIDDAVAAGIKSAMEKVAAETAAPPVQQDLAQFRLDKPHFDGFELLSEGTEVTLPDGEEPSPDWHPLNAKAEEATAKVRARAATLNRLQMQSAAKLEANALPGTTADIVDEEIDAALEKIREPKIDPARDPAFDRRPAQDAPAAAAGIKVVVPAPAASDRPARKPRTARASDAEI